MSKTDLDKPMLFRQEFLDNLDNWITDEKLEKIFFISSEEEKELAEKRKRDAKVIKPEFLDDWNY